MLQPVIGLRMFGSFDLRAAGKRVLLSPSVERVVAYVALHHGPATRSNVAGTLWIDVPEERAMANLRSALWRLRRAGPAILETRGDCLALEPHIRVDTHELLTTSHDLIDGNREVDLGELDRLAASSELLADWSDEWVLVEREHFRQLRLHALERIAVDLAHRGLFGRAAETALAAVASEPLRESAHRALISVHLAQGNRSEAIRQYGTYRRMLRSELDLEPSRQMDDMLAELAPATIDRMMGPLMAR